MGDRRTSLPAQGPYGGALPQQVTYQNAPQESLPPMPEPQTVARAPVQQQYSAPPPQPQVNAYSPAPPIAGLATIEEDSESQAGTIKTLQKLPTIGKTGTKGTAGNSVSRNNIEQFEAMAEAEEDEEEVKRQMIAMGMQPDEDAFPSRRGDSQDVPASRVAAEAPVETHAASSSRRTDASQASSTSTYRPRASDIFQTVSHGPQPQAPSAEQGQHAPAPVETVKANVGRSQDTAASSELRTADDSQSAIPRRPSVASLRRSSSSHGIGLQALETNLVRSTKPKITTSSRVVVTMANVARADSSSSPLASPSVGHDDSTRSRKNSALRAAALAREEAERKSAEEQARAAEERERQLQAEQARQAAAAEKEAAQREAARIFAAEQQRLERERIAEHARRQRELREQEEEQRLKAAEAERIAREQEVKRQEQEREESERRSRQAAEALAAQKRAESRRLADIAAIKSSASSERLDRINAAIGNAPSSIAPSVPSKTTAPTFAAPGKMSDRDRVALKRQAVHRIDGWLSSAASPNPSHMETPGTPSASVLSVMRKEPEPSTVLNDEARSSFAYRSPSQVINPLWDGKSSRSQANESAMPKSRTMTDLTCTKASVAATAETCATRREEPIPQLSAELRALVDSSEIRPARKSGTALKEHPISRRLSGLGSTDKTAAIVAPAASVTQKSSSETKRERHTSMPCWPRPGLPGSDVGAVPAAVVPASSSSSNVYNSTRVVRNPEAREVGIPSRVEKTLMAPTAEGTTRAKDEPGYDARSARGGRGGRVASVAQLWSKIAGDDEVGDDEVGAADAGRSSLAAPQTDLEPRSASPSSASTVKPKARRLSNAAGGAPALDFSKKAMTSSASVGVTTIAATFGGSASSAKPESLKSFTAPQFLNTSVSKPVFAKPNDQCTPAPLPAKAEKRPLPKPVLQPGAVPAPQLVRPTAMRPPAAADRPSRRISTQLLSTFEKDKSHTKEEASVREMMSKVAVDSTNLGALQSVEAPNHDLSTLRCADGTEAKITMSGRGTTKAIGENKLKSLRAVWGS